jgi:type III secretion protein J
MPRPPPRPALALVALLVTACGSTIQHGLEERDANELVSVLVARGFHAAKAPEQGKRPTWAVEVDAAEATEALRVLTELKLPRPARATTRSLVESPGLIETPAGERLRQLEAEEGDLEEALETMTGVTQASVELVVPGPPRPGQPASPSKAAVLLRVHPEALDRLAQARGELKALVAGGVEGLRAEEVVLVLDPVTLLPPVPPERAVGPGRPLLVALAGGVGVLTVVLLALAALLARQRRGAGRGGPAEPATPRPGSSTPWPRKAA